MVVKYVGIVGSRDRKDKENVEKLVDRLDEDTVVVSGGCKGIDTWAEERARERGLSVLIHPPRLEEGLDYHEMCERYYQRNKRIVESSDIVYAFVSDDRSGGTENTLHWCKKLGVEYVIMVGDFNGC